MNQALIQELVQAMRENPHETAEGLILADLLEDSEDPQRADFIRTELTLQDWVADVEKRERLQAHSRSILEANQLCWLGNLPCCSQSWRTRHGFFDLVMTTNQFLHSRFANHARTNLLGRWVRNVKLIKVTGTELADLARARHLSMVTSLDLQGNRIDDRLLRRFLDSPYLDNLVQLDLANNRLTGASLEYLTAGKLPMLKEIDVRNNRIRSLPSSCLSRFPDLGGLSRLELHGNDLHRRVFEENAIWQTLRKCPLRSGDEPRLVTNSLGMEFVRIPAGSFRMGSPKSEPNRRDNEEPQHIVELTKGFYLGRFQVTQAQYLEVMGNNPSTFHANNRGGIYHPVDNVSRGDAEMFCERLNQMPRERDAGRVYRLPTEAEWEHACRAGASSEPTHYGSSLASSQANFDGGRPYNRARLGEYRLRTTIVGSFAPNAFGLYDMHGNVWEWCADSYDRFAYSQEDRTDPRIEGSPHRGILRGGSWHSDGPWCRSAYRCSDSVESRFNWNGFRVVVDYLPILEESDEG